MRRLASAAVAFAVVALALFMPRRALVAKRLSSTPRFALGEHLQPPLSSYVPAPTPTPSQKQNILTDAVAWSLAAIVTSPAADESVRSNDGSWAMAATLVASLQIESTPTSTSPFPRDVPPPPLRPSASSSSRDIQGCDDECLLVKASSVGAWDADARRFVPPRREQMPPRPATTTEAQEDAAPAHQLLASLVNAASRRRPRQVVDKQRELDVRIVEGSREEAAAEQRWQFAQRVLSPRTRAHAGRQCWSQCASLTGPCAWCGARLCCRANRSEDSALCHGTRAVLTRHACVEAPGGVEEATLNALDPWATVPHASPLGTSRDAPGVVLAQSGTHKSPKRKRAATPWWNLAL